jgi:O-antigen biosynthesis protein
MVTKVMKTIVRSLLARQMQERMDESKAGFFLQRTWADHLARYRFATQYVNGKTVLDIACGDGYGTKMLSKTAKEITGVDLSGQTIQKLNKANTPDSKITFICSDAIHFLRTEKKQYKVIVSFETIEHLIEYKLFVHLLNERLSPGGTLLLSTPNKFFSDLIAGDTFNPFHCKEFYTEELQELLMNKFHSTPQLFLQRPVTKKYLIPSAIRHFILQKESILVPANPQLMGIDDLFVITR